MSPDNKGYGDAKVMKGYGYGVLMDLSKVFNVLNHNLLLAKV